MINPGAVFDTFEFNDRYTCPEGELGVSFAEDGCRFTVWAPTASDVELTLYYSGDLDETPERHGMSYTGRGVWDVTIPEDVRGRYYCYVVSTVAGTFETVDPYARSAGANGRRGMVIDLSSTDPEGWEKDTFIDNIDRYTDAVIWETHVTDFSCGTPAFAHGGKFLAFTERGVRNGSGMSVGIDYLRDLGVTHVQLQPVADNGSVDELGSNVYNWGYDPLNYNSPEGIYSTDPRDGASRVREMKQMVMALHSAGIGVIMDVVYNHTYTKRSNFNKIVPGYYYRTTEAGEYTDGSGCGNETASERIMFRRFMLESVLYWQREYHIDGFRFDLMALHDLETISSIEQAVHRVNPKAIICGEGWTGGRSALRAALRTSQENIEKFRPRPGIAGTVAVFNDVMRDSLRGNNFYADGRGFVNGAAEGNAHGVVFGMRGAADSMGMFGYNTSGACQNINYVSCHDNLTLYDKLCAVMPGASEDRIAAMNRLAAAAVFTGQGIPFMLSGEEMLRSKGGNSNSYNAPAYINRIAWENLVPGSRVDDLRNFYRGLIALRRARPVFRGDADDTEFEYRIDENGTVFVTLTGHGEQAAVILNAIEKPVEWQAEDDFELFVLDGAAGTSPIGAVRSGGTLTVPGCSAAVLIRKTEEEHL